MSATPWYCLVIAFVGLLCPQRALGQAPPQGPPPPGEEPGQLMSPQQLDDLVAPIALDPDPLLGEVLAASTYPMELAEADQWARDHANWKPAKLMDEAKKQNWDPSVQGLVAFPNVLQQLTQNMSWTTQLGDAFLAQQADVMQAVQRMRAQAQARGTLRSTPQETVTTEEQNGQPEIAIEPANPDMWYVPDYNPDFIWGPPAWGYYPALAYPGVGIGLGWYPGIDLGLWFGGWGGWGWGGWGWTPDWYGGNIFIDRSFFHRFGFQHFHDEGIGRSVWMHNPAHRLGVPYANRGVAQRFGATGGYAGGRFGGGAGFRGGAGGRMASEGGFRGAAGGNGNRSAQQRFGSPGFEQRGWTGNHSVFGGYHNGGMTRMQSDHGFASMGAARSAGGFHGGGFHGGGFHGGGAPRGGGRR